MPLKSIYTYLDEMGFDEKIEHEQSIIKKATKSDSPVVTKLYLSNMVFNIIQEFYSKVLADYREEKGVDND